MARLRNLLAGIGLGVGAMYFFDPRVGRRRRALLRDQFVHALTKTRKNADAKARDLRNRAYGVIAETRGNLLGRARNTASQNRDMAEDLAEVKS